MTAVWRFAIAIASAIAASMATPLTAQSDRAMVEIDAPLYDGADGVSCGYFNVGASIPWQRQGGDWLDRARKLHGNVPHVQQRVVAENRVRTVQLDITDLAASGLQSSRRRLELMLREVSARRGGTIHFYSREAAPERAPQLVIEFADGKTVRVAASADAQISCSTYRALGTGAWLTVAHEFGTAIAFDLKDLPSRPIKSASLSLTSRQRQYGDVTLGVFELVNPLQHIQSTPRQAGFAARYPGDRRLTQEPAVAMFEEFESADWRRRWSEVSGDLEVVGSEDQFGFVPFAGRALRVRIGEGRGYGGSLRFKFGEKMGREPEEAYFRYMLRFGDDWLPSPEGGKLPGFASTYGRAAWGGRRADGGNGWSARGSFNAASDAGNPLHGLTTIGFYTYHADMPARHGEIWPWTQRAPALLANNRWYAIEQHVKLNTPGKNDGVLRAWVDGVLVFERTDLRFRDTDELKIEEVWMNVYFGGTRPSSRTMHLYIDNVVLADRYIGPVGGTATTASMQR